MIDQSDMEEHFEIIENDVGSVARYVREHARVGGA